MYASFHYGDILRADARARTSDDYVEERTVSPAWCISCIITTKCLIRLLWLSRWHRDSEASRYYGDDIVCRLTTNDFRKTSKSRHGCMASPPPGHFQKRNVRSRAFGRNNMPSSRRTRTFSCGDLPRQIGRLRAEFRTRLTNANRDPYTSVPVVRLFAPNVAWRRGVPGACTSRSYDDRADRAPGRFTRCTRNSSVHAYGAIVPTSVRSVRAISLSAELARRQYFPVAAAWIFSRPFYRRVRFRRRLFASHHVQDSNRRDWQNPLCENKTFCTVPVRC